MSSIRSVFIISLALLPGYPLALQGASVATMQPQALIPVIAVTGLATGLLGYGIYRSIISPLQNIRGLGQAVAFLGQSQWQNNLANNESPAAIQKEIAYFLAKTQPNKKLATLGIPTWLAYMGAFGEFIGGLMILLGIATELGAVILAVDMMFAIYLVHWGHGYFIQNNGGEYSLNIIVLCVALIIGGPGCYVLWRI